MTFASIKNKTQIKKQRFKNNQIDTYYECMLQNGLLYRCFVDNGQVYRSKRSKQLMFIGNSKTLDEFINCIYLDYINV